MKLFTYFLLLFGLSSNLYGAAKFIFLTGSPGGVYYPAGKQLTASINQAHIKDFQLEVKTSPGSVFNINSITGKTAQFALVQIDKFYQATNGLGEWKLKGPQKDLRVIANFHLESIALVTLKESGISSLQDLKGKKVNIGNPGSGQRSNALAVIKAAGLNWQSDIQAISKKAESAHRDLLDGKIDAYFHTVGHPCNFIKESQSSIKLVPITGIKKWDKGHAIFKTTQITTTEYPHILGNKNIPTYGMYSVLITHKDTDDQAIYNFTSWILNNVKKLKNFHPAWQKIDKNSLLEQNKSLFHPAVLKLKKDRKL